MNRRARRRKQVRRQRRILALFGILLFVVIGSVLLIKGLTKEEKTVETSATIKEENKEPIELEEKEPEVYTASILSAGDVILHSPFISSRVYHQGNGVYDYNALFSQINSYYQAADFTVVNFESTVSTSNYSGYPSFRSPAAIVSALKQNHVDMCLLANNHIYDNHDNGLTMTMNSMDEHQLPYTGTQRTASDINYTIQDINGIKVGFFNYVYETGAAGDGQKSINANPVSAASADLINTFHYDDLEAFYNEIPALKNKNFSQ